MQCKQHVATAEGVTPKEIYEECRLFMVVVCLWVNKCKNCEAGTSDMHDKQRVGGPMTAISVLHRENIDRLIQDYRLHHSVSNYQQNQPSTSVDHIIDLLGY